MAVKQYKTIDIIFLSVALFSLSVAYQDESNLSTNRDFFNYLPENKIIYPKNVEELQKIVRLAREKGYKICVVGSGMSQNDQNVGGKKFITLKLDAMNKVEINAQQHTAIVVGNVNFGELEDAANEHSLAVKTRQASAIFGVLSSISTNVHGWDYKTGCIGSTVNWVNVIDEMGNSLLVEKIHLNSRNVLVSLVPNILFGAQSCNLRPM